MFRETDKQTDRQTDRQTETDRQTDRMADRRALVTSIMNHFLDQAFIFTRAGGEGSK